MNNDSIELRRMRPEDRDAVAELIHLSTNHWYESHTGSPVFRGEPAECRIFADTYETLDPGCCLIAALRESNRIVGSCFFHPRSTHVSVGIVNTHPAYAGRGVARRLIAAVLDRAGDQPIRLVSSLMNLDSYSLYTRAGFVPRTIYQDMWLPTFPPDGLPPTGPDDERVRSATIADVEAIANAERVIVGVERLKDWRFFLTDMTGSWHVSVLIGAEGTVTGALASVSAPASRMIGPGFARTEAQAAALLRAALNRRSAVDTPVFLVPAQASLLVAQCYAWGARNIELHVAQVRGAWSEPQGVVFPTFLPETG